LGQSLNPEPVPQKISPPSPGNEDLPPRMLLFRPSPRNDPVPPPPKTPDGPPLPPQTPSRAACISQNGQLARYSRWPFYLPNMFCIHPPCLRLIPIIITPLETCGVVPPKPSTDPLNNFCYFLTISYPLLLRTDPNLVAQTLLKGTLFGLEALFI